MLEIKGVSKSFPGVKAVDDVSVTIEPGEMVLGKQPYSE